MLIKLEAWRLEALFFCPAKLAERQPRDRAFELGPKQLTMLCLRVAIKLKPESPKTAKKLNVINCL